MHRFPAEYAEIVARHNAYRAYARDDLFEMRRRDLRDAVSCCVGEGVYPSRRRVFEHAGLARMFRRVPRYIQVWLDALREHGIRSA